MLPTCTRVVYLGAGDRVFTGRSMDWEYAIDLWAFPRGVKRTGAAGEKAVLAGDASARFELEEPFAFMAVP